MRNHQERKRLEAENKRLRAQLEHAPSAPIIVTVAIPRDMYLRAGDSLTITARLTELRVGEEMKGEIVPKQAEAAQGILDRGQAIENTCAERRDNPAWPAPRYCLKPYGHDDGPWFEQVPEQLAHALDMVLKARRK